MAKVFISYVQENLTDVSRLVDALKKRGIHVWMDKDSLLPGTRWKDVIKDAIRNGDFFIACFSEQYHQRDKTYMNEELVLAIEELRMRSTNQSWFIPVVLNECNVPARSIGAGETLLDLHWINLYLDWDAGINKITQVILSDELETAKRELDNLARWIRKKEDAGDGKLADRTFEKYEIIRKATIKKFGVNHDPRREQYNK